MCDGGSDASHIHHLPIPNMLDRHLVPREVGIDWKNGRTEKKCGRHSQTKKADDSTTDSYYVSRRQPPVSQS